MLRGVSDTAKYGGLVYGPKVIDEETKAKMKLVLDNILRGTFAKEWMSNPEESNKRLKALMEASSKHPIEKTGKEVRKLMGQER
jgi:ketol-acid reductoisomerase